ncbi:MAG: methyltransferase domain-containing protein [Alcanivorax sp.]|nr:methyltransferase domain-containing protein [Alcanivorax sp.]
MSDALQSQDWANGRGGKWQSQLSAIEAMLKPVDTPLLVAMDLSRPGRIADIGCGGGGTSLAIAARAAAGSQVYGFDIAPELVASARERAVGADAPVIFEQSDVTVADLPSLRFDQLVSRFGIMFFAEPAAAFARLADWLTPGGSFTFAVWGPADDNLWMDGARREVAAVMALPEPDWRAPGPFRYGDPDPLLALLADADFSGLHVDEWRGPLPVGGGLAPEQAADFALSSFAISERLADADESQRQTARQRLTERFRNHVSIGEVWMDARVHLVSGRR